ncbi:MAG: hypothetical protein AABX13_03260 [Nanoarchaeota archaeon]
MPHLRYLLREQQLYDKPLGQLMELVHAPTTEIEPNDLLDYSLNCGHRHRLLEGWEIKDGQQHTVGFNANDYPERLFFYTLAKRAVDESYTSKFEGKLGDKSRTASPAEFKAELKRFLRKEYRLLDPKLQPDWNIGKTVEYWDQHCREMCCRLDEEELAENTEKFAGNLYLFCTLGRATRQLGGDILMKGAEKGGLATALTERQIRLPPEEYGKNNYPLAGLLSAVPLFLHDESRAGLVALMPSRKVQAAVNKVKALDEQLR